MRKTYMSATLAALAVAATLAAGCSGGPKSVRRVDQSVLPASAKAMFSQDAEITRVEELTYSKGAKQYRVHYNVDGKSKVISISDADETRPTGVFEHPAQ